MLIIDRCALVSLLVYSSSERDLIAEFIILSERKALLTYIALHERLNLLNTRILSLN